LTGFDSCDIILKIEIMIKSNLWEK